MVYFKLIERHGTVLIYEYYPNGVVEDKGLISYDSASGEFKVLEPAVTEHKSFPYFAFHCAKGIREGKDHGYSAWY